ncbi:hypothetical protein D2V93_08445 [Flagellimonas taeanensis]|nr:hypothetical protein D2V93_08445 [Allomuricauda taeanensis]
MTPEEVQRIAERVFNDNIDILGKLLKRLPKSNVREACDLLGCSRKWLYENAIILGGKRKNKRGDWEFDTLTLARYKLRRNGKRQSWS